MCGISGLYKLQGEINPDDIQAIKCMMDSQIHRGPDDQGIITSPPSHPRVVLGHRRLSIIDLSPTGRQPMSNEDGTVWITYGGEIYNYRELRQMLIENGHKFKSNSDTEVIIHGYEQWGVEGLLIHLRGMFAFAIWDERTETLLLVRDRIGIKPLYYYLSKEQAIFASELKALLASKKINVTIDMGAIWQYMRILTVPLPLSITKEIKKLEPGYYLIVNKSGQAIKKQYWDFKNYISQTQNMDFDKSKMHLQHLLKDSIQYHMVTDTPVGVFLSGGLDSSSIVALMRQARKSEKILTFSIAFPGYEEYDEAKYALIVANHFNIDHQFEKFSANFIKDFSKIAWYLDEPFAISSAFAIYYLAQAAVRKVKIVLTGDGGDELFAGYPGYQNDNYLKYNYNVRKIIENFANSALFFYKNFGIQNKMMKIILAKLYRKIGTDGLLYSKQISQTSFLSVIKAINPDFTFELWNNWQNNLTAYYYDSLDSDDNLIKKIYAECKTRLVDEMLTKVDRMTMAHSLEARVPLLDHKIIEFVFGLPSSFKLHRSENFLDGKHIFKKTMESFLPPKILNRNKHPFNIPMENWISGSLFSVTEDVLFNGILIKNKIISSLGLKNIIREEKQNNGRHTNMILALLTFEYWYNTFKKQFSNISF